MGLKLNLSITNHKAVAYRIQNILSEMRQLRNDFQLTNSVSKYLFKAEQGMQRFRSEMQECMHEEHKDTANIKIYYPSA